MKSAFNNFLGSAAASAAVRRALASNTAARGQPTASNFTRDDANDEGVIGCARGGRAPQIKLG